MDRSFLFYPTDGSETTGPGLVYPKNDQRTISGLYLSPNLHVANDDSVVFLKGIDVDYGNIWGDFDYLYGVQVKFDNSSFVQRHKPLKSDIAWYNFSAQNTIDGYAADGVGPFPRIIAYWANFCDAGHTEDQPDWTADLVAGFELRDHEPNGCVWGGSATINNFYGVLIENQPAAGAKAKKWWAGAFGGPVLIEKDQSLFWGPDLRTAERDGSAGLKWNSRTRQLETSIGGAAKTRLSSKLWTVSGAGIVQSTCLKTRSAEVLRAEGCNIVVVTGSDAVRTIKSCDAENSGRQFVVLCGSSTARFVDGTNLRLSGDFACTADDSLTLLCDGMNWIELTRSVN